MSKYASKGTAVTGLVTGITALAGQVAGDGGILSGITGSNKSQEKVSALEADNARLRAEKYTDGAVLDLFKNTQSELKERDNVITATLIEEGKQEERINCLKEKVTKLQEVQEVHTKEIYENKYSLGILSERQMATTQALSDKIECQGNEIYAYVNGNFARNKKVIPTENLCQRVVAQSDVLNYYLAGNTSATPNATNGTCCPSSCSCGKNLDTRSTPNAD